MTFTEDAGRKDRSDHNIYRQTDDHQEAPRVNHFCLPMPVTESSFFGMVQKYGAMSCKSKFDDSILLEFNLLESHITRPPKHRSVISSGRPSSCQPALYGVRVNLQET